MTSLLAARREHFTATFSLHTRTESVCLGAASFPRLKCTLRQSIPPYWCLRCPSFRNYKSLFARATTGLDGLGSFPSSLRDASMAASELSSVLAARAQGQENRGVSYREGKTATPAQCQCKLGARELGGRVWRVRVCGRGVAITRFSRFRPASRPATGGLCCFWVRGSREWLTGWCGESRRQFASLP